MHPAVRLLLMLTLLLPPAASAQVEAPALATFQTADGSFVVRVTDPGTVDTLQALLDGTIGPLGVLGDWRTGNRGYNRNGAENIWSWHLDEQTLALTAAAPEVCDGLPSAIEARVNLGTSFRRYCPWGGVIVALRDDDSLRADVTVDGEVGPADHALLVSCLALDGSPCFDAADGCCAGDITGDEAVTCADWQSLADGWTAAGAAPVPTGCEPGVPALPGATTAALLILLALAAGAAAFRQHAPVG